MDGLVTTKCYGNVDFLAFSAVAVKIIKQSEYW